MKLDAILRKCHLLIRFILHDVGTAEYLNNTSTLLHLSRETTEIVNAQESSVTMSDIPIFLWIS
jgi:hypothetical protein